MAKRKMGAIEDYYGIIRTEEQERLIEMEQTFTLIKIFKMFWWIQVSIIVSQLNNIWHSFSEAKHSDALCINNFAPFPHTN